MTKAAFIKLQTGLAELGYKPGTVDGVWGPNTRAATRALLDADGKPAPATAAAPSGSEPPWITEGRRVLGRHETRDNSFLREWLKSDGSTLGDPAKLPWCGDFVETCIRLALPTEPFPGALGQNPYWARNWNLLGSASPELYGAILVFERDSGGHVGFGVGQDATAFYVLGGNQSNTVSIAPVAKDRLIGCRWPSTYARTNRPLPAMTRGTMQLSTNEV